MNLADACGDGGRRHERVLRCAGQKRELTELVAEKNCGICGNPPYTHLSNDHASSAVGSKRIDDELRGRGNELDDEENVLKPFPREEVQGVAIHQHIKS
jgi:hypothetical protein